MTRLLAPFALIALALALVIRLDHTPTDADLVFVHQNEVFTLDPQRMSYVGDLRLAHVLYEGLVEWDVFDFSILPGAARAVPRVSQDGLTYTFELRPEARWSNGDPLTAHDFVYSWKRAILPDTVADYSNMFFVIDGAEAFFQWRTAQTAAFVADPWADPDRVDPAVVTALIDRLRALLGADDLPPEVAMPLAGEREAALAELTALRRTADVVGADLLLRRKLAEVPHTRTWRERLDEPASRAAEALWMWERSERRFAETVGLRATGVRTLEVRLRQPTAYFLDLLCFGVFFPVHRPTVEGWPVSPFEDGWHAAAAPAFEDRRWVAIDARSGRFEQKHEWAKPGRHVGNGTHVLAQWRYKRDLRLERNPLYHNPGRVRAGSIVALTIEDTNTAVLAFESGHVDWLADVDADYQSDMLDERRRYVARHRAQLDEMLAQGLPIDEALASLPPPGRGERRNIHVLPTFGTDFYSFNCRPDLADGRPNPFADPRVRRAFVMSVNKNTIVERVTRLHEPVTTTLVPPGTIDGYHSPAGLPHDPDRARSELAAAGWSNQGGDGLARDAEGRTFPVIDLLYTTNVPRYKWISLNLKAQWERELGVRVEMRPAETKFYREDLRKGNFMIARGRWYGDYGDPTTFLELCKSTDGNNDRSYACAEVDDLLEGAARERDPERRLQLLEACERIICERDVPMLVLCQLVQVYMYEPGRVTGLSDHPRLTQFLWKIEVDHHGAAAEETR